MKVLVFGMTENAGGIESVLLNYYTHMDKERIQMDFLCNTETVAYEEILRENGAEIIRVPMRSQNRSGFYAAMDRFFQNHAKEYDAIWVNVCSLANIDYLKYAKKYGIPRRIIHSHNSANMDSRARRLLHEWNKLFLKKYATDFWTCSRESADWFYPASIRQSGKLVYLQNAIDIPSYAFDPAVRQKIRRQLNLDGSFVIGHVGRLHFQKNQSFLLDIFTAVRKKKADSVLLLIGQGEDENLLRQKADALGIADSVRFLGAQEDVRSLLQAMDVFVFPSLFEGLPMALLEAEASGLDCFISDTIDSSVQVLPTVHALSLKEGAEVWADSILAGVRPRQGQNVDKMVRAGFDISSQAHKLEELLDGDI